MKFLYRILKQDPNDREGVIIATSVLGILVNLVLGVMKIMIGTAVASIAIVSEGVNHAADTATSLLTIVGTKLSNKQPTEKHPFGYGRIEYLTSMIISVLILFTGFELFKSSVELLFHPAEISVSVVTLVIIALSAGGKLLLGTFTIREGKRVDSSSLVAVGTESRGDSIVSVITIVSALVFLITGKNIDAFAGIFTSLFIMKAGIEIISDTLGDFLGRSGDKEIADKIYDIIRAEPMVVNAADMMLHNYGPDRYSGSVNIEIDHKYTVGEIYAVIHALQLKIMHEHNIVMVFGIYAIDADSEHMRELREYIEAFVAAQEHVRSYHALYLEPETNKIYCDLVVDYKLRNWDALREEFSAYVAKKYPGKDLELVIETEYV